MRVGKLIALSICFLIIIATYSCRKAEDPCSTNNPAQDFPWLQSHLDSIDREPCNIEVHIFKYDGEHTVYVIGCSDLGEPSLLFDCSGTQLCEFNEGVGVNTCPDFVSTNEYVGQVYPF